MILRGLSKNFGTPWETTWICTNVVGLARKTASLQVCGTAAAKSESLLLLHWTRAQSAALDKVMGLTRAIVMAAPMPADPPVTIAFFPSSISLLQGKAGSSGAGLPGMMI